jgi:hypothetical protein
MSTSTPESTLKSACHCGRIQITLPSRPAELNECHCTVCYKYGAMWAYFDPETVDVTIADGATLEGYRRSDEDGSGDISFNRCSHCGCMMAWRGAGAREGIKKMGVNCRMVPELDIEGIPKKIGMGPRSGGKK